VVIPVRTALASGASLANCAVFKVRWEGACPDWAPGLSKLNSMTTLVRGPGPVDIRY